MAADAINGPREKPMFPPVENTAMPLARCRPLAACAARIPSG
jgi:hypothetical protein